MTIKIATLNIWQEQGPWQERLDLTCRQLARLGPQVICLQEVREVDGKIPNQARTIARRLDGMNWTFEVAQDWGGGDEGLAILSSYPVLDRVTCELPYTEGRSRRVCLGVLLEAPEGRFWAFTTHLAWRLADGALREQQVLAVDRLIQARDPGEVALLTGDFNAIPDSDEMRYLRGLTTLDGGRTFYQDAFASCNPGVPGHTWVSENPYTQMMGWIELDRRLDYIYMTPRSRDGSGKISSSRIICSEPDERGIRCSDHHGLMAEVAVGSTD